MMRFLRATASGLMLDFALVPANVSDGALAEQLLIGQRDLTVLGGKAYIDSPLQALLARRNHLHITYNEVLGLLGQPTRASQHRPFRTHATC
jgi:hypothetical protein